MIEFKGVHKWFGPLHVLNDINLFIKPGEVVVVCGPSGSGKSTLIRCINRLESIQKGTIVVDGMSLNDRKTNLTKLRAEVGMVFQQFNLYPHKSALQNIVLAPIKVRKQSREEAGRFFPPNPRRKQCLMMAARSGLAPGPWPSPMKTGGWQAYENP